MTQEERELLFKDLCGRLPYGVKCLVDYTFCNETTDYEDVKSSTVDTLITINQQTESYFFEYLSEWFDVDEFKPYLFPLSSMTEEQRKEMEENCLKFPQSGVLMPTYKTFDFFNKHHIDFRGLIEQGLANDATGLNIY